MLAFERNANLQLWLKLWLPKKLYIKDHPMDWFFTGHGILGFEVDLEGFDRPVLHLDSTYVWLPPPYAANVALWELRKSHLKRWNRAHFCLPAFVHCSVALTLV